MAKRVQEELERRREEIEAEVQVRVEEAKKIMEAQMLEEIERRKQEQLEEVRKREVKQNSPSNRSGQRLLPAGVTEVSRVSHFPHVELNLKLILMIITRRRPRRSNTTKLVLPARSAVEIWTSASSEEAHTRKKCSVVSGI